MNTPVDHASEMNAEERKIWIGHRINEISYNRAPLGLQLIVFTSKRNDLRPRLRAAQPCHPVTVQPGTVDNPASRKSAGRRFQNRFAAILSEPVNLGAQSQFPPRV